MKRFILLVAFLLGAQIGFSQTWNEWFRQRRTQIRYLVKQIAGLQVYAEFLQKGYSIAKDGTTLIKDIKNGDLNIHNGYFSSLKAVSPAIKHYSEIKELVSTEIEIQRIRQSVIRIISNSQFLSPSEKSYILSVCNKVNVESNFNAGLLSSLTTTASLELKEDERLRNIDMLHTSASERLSFCKSFKDQILLLIVARQYHEAEARNIHNLYGTK